MTTDRDALYIAMRDCIKDSDSELVDFSSVTQRHLQLLGLDATHDIEYRREAVEEINSWGSQPNKILRNTGLKAFQDHFDISTLSGRRCIIHQFLAAAIIYAQVLLEKDAPLRQSIVSRFNIQQPHLAVFTELSMPQTRITCGDKSYVFHGLLDYGIGFVKKRDTASLSRGTLLLDPSKTLCAVLEARSLSEMIEAEAHITIQVLSCLAVTNRDSFTGVLTNGTLWRFFQAQGGTANLRIYTSPELASDKDQGFIIELLKNMILFEASHIFRTKDPIRPQSALSEAKQ